MSLPGLFANLQVPLEFCSFTELCEEEKEYEREEGDVIANDSFYQLIRLMAFSKKNKTRKRKTIPQINTKKK